MTQLEVIEVNEKGERLDGSPLMTATKEAILAGVMVNVPVVLRYPNGREVRGHDARITPEGMRQLAAQMGDGIRH